MNRTGLAIALVLGLTAVGCKRQEPKAPAPAAPAVVAAPAAAPGPTETPAAAPVPVAPAPAAPAPTEAPAAPAAAPASEEGIQAIKISGMDAPNMVYDPKEIRVKAGQRVRLTLTNTGKMPKLAMGHNLLILKKGETFIDFGIAAASPTSGANLTNDFIPTNPALKAKILWHTKLLGPGESDTIEFTAPTEAGVYHFVCTFTAHFATMNGKMIVE